MSLFDGIAGRLSFDYLPQDMITQGGAASMVFIGIAAVAAMFYFKKWTWLWENWITTLDAKKIGVMYIIVAVIMGLRGIADAMMIRVQQVVGSGGGEFVNSDTFQQVFSADRKSVV